jgi:6-phosphogluconolactonase (cycloisomerase 2 family)
MFEFTTPSGVFSRLKFCETGQHPAGSEQEPATPDKPQINHRHNEVTRMRISPKQLLQGLLYTTPVLLLVLASCGGGGGGGSSATLASAYTLSVNVTGISGVTGTSGVVLRNGGDNLNVTTTGTPAFAHQVLSGSTYNISVLSQPTPPQRCTVTGPVAVMPASNTTVGVNCVPAFTIGGVGAGAGVTGLAAGTSVVLQNNGGDNKMVSASGNFTFDTPVASGVTYTVSVLTQPANQTCTRSSYTGAANANKINVLITCTTNATPPQPDQHVYVANYGSDQAWTYPASGVLNTQTQSNTGSKPSAIAVYGSKYAFVTNSAANTVSAYSVASGVLSVSPVANTATGYGPAAIAVHPSGKFAYVVNKLSNSISAYSIDPSTGTLASIDADANTSGMQPTIATAYIPVAIAINPAGTYAYVASLGSSAIGVCSHISSNTKGCISLYSIDPSTGALTATSVSGFGTNIDTGVTPSAIAVDGTNVYVTNQAGNSGNGSISVYAIGVNGTIILSNTCSVPTGTGPSGIALDRVNNYGYIACASNNYVSWFSITGTSISFVNAASTGVGTSPASISIDSTGQYVYVANSGNNTITAFQITGGGATLSPVSNSPFPAGATPVSVTTSP